MGTSSPVHVSPSLTVGVVRAGRPIHVSTNDPCSHVVCFFARWTIEQSHRHSCFHRYIRDHDDIARQKITSQLTMIPKTNQTSGAGKQKTLVKVAPFTMVRVCYVLYLEHPVASSSTAAGYGELLTRDGGSIPRRRSLHPPGRNLVDIDRSTLVRQANNMQKRAIVWVACHGKRLRDNTGNVGGNATVNVWTNPFGGCRATVMAPFLVCGRVADRFGIFKHRVNTQLE
jgi:hypothetical protein